MGRSHLKTNATGLGVAEKHGVSEDAIIIGAHEFDAVAVPEGKGEAQNSHSKRAYAVPENVELLEGFRLPCHPVPKHNPAENTDDNQDILVPLSTRGIPVHHMSAWTCWNGRIGLSRALQDVVYSRGFVIRPFIHTSH